MPRGPSESHGHGGRPPRALPARRRARSSTSAPTPAYDGARVTSQLLRTRDFRTFDDAPGSAGPGSSNKGLALFPRAGRRPLRRACRAPTARATPSPPRTTCSTGTSPCWSRRRTSRGRSSSSATAGRPIETERRLAGAHPRGRPDARVQHRRAAARPGRTRPSSLGRLRRPLLTPTADERSATCPTSSTPAAPCCTAARSSSRTAAATRRPVRPGRPRPAARGARPDRRRPPARTTPRPPGGRHERPRPRPHGRPRPTFAAPAARTSPGGTR